MQKRRTREGNPLLSDDVLESAGLRLDLRNRSDLLGKRPTEIFVGELVLPSGVHEHAVVFDFLLSKPERKSRRILAAGNGGDYSATDETLHHRFVLFAFTTGKFDVAQTSSAARTHFAIDQPVTR